MNILKNTTLAILAISFAFPASVFANQDTPEEQLRKAMGTAQSTFNELQQAGTEFYLDRSKKQKVDLSDLKINRNGSIKIYAVTPFDPELRTRLGLYQSLRIDQNGQVGITLEVLKDGGNALSSFPVRAIKSVKINGKDAKSIRIQFTQTIQAAVSIAKNQIQLGRKSESKVNSLFARLMNVLIPESNAGVMNVIGGTIVGIYAVLTFALAAFVLQLIIKNWNDWIYGRNYVVGIFSVATMVGSVLCGIFAYGQFKKASK